jgi:hypothetical protein
MSAIAIIGGGPAGIALARQLDQLGISYVLFEAGQMAETWRSVPADLTVLSPWWTNTLGWRDMFDCNPFAKVPALTYVEHLMRISRRLRGDIRERTRVAHIRKDGSQQWIIQTEQGTAQTFAKVVLATGYYQSPKGAEPAFSSDGSVPVLHAAAIHDYQQLMQFSADKHPVLVIGKRVTAGQLIVELHQRQLRCLLSVKTQVEYRRHGTIAALREQLYFFWEELQLWLHPGLKRNSYPVMDGGLTQQLIESGEVEVMPPVLTVTAGEVVFTDQQRRHCAAIICATGYDPSLGLLQPLLNLAPSEVPAVFQYEVEGLPNLFLLGFDNIADHRSRYLRGIRRDAVILAKRLMQR